MVKFVYKCLQRESSLVNGIARHRIIYGQMDSIIARNILNCSFRYKISLENILYLHFQPRDIYSYLSCKRINSSALLSSLIELLQCREVVFLICQAANLVWRTYRR